MEWTKEQESAINKDNTNIIVSASAGSGKTAVLTQRVIKKLESGIKINELLILTFTNLAAKEMKDRIRKSIKGKENLKDNLVLLDSAYITTFDSYALSIVKKYSEVLNISSNVKITESSIILLEKIKILDNIFDELYDSKDAKFIKFITDFCVKNDNYIKESILNIYNKLDMKYDKQTYLDNYLNNYFNESYINDLVNEYKELLLSYINDIKQSITDLSYHVDNNYLNEISDSLNNLLNANTYNEIKANLNIKLKQLPKNSSPIAKNIKNNIKEKIDMLISSCSYNDEEEIKESIKLTYNYEETIIKILKKLDDDIIKLKQDNGLYEFIDISKLAIKLVSENKDICDDIKNTYKEIMIDEYQDTNDLQELFISKISNNNTYMVGDIKQSIYAFRNANVNIFKSKYEAYSNNLGGIKIDLNKNFRSKEEVVDKINLIFDNIMSLKEGGANYIKSHQMTYGNIFYKLFKTNQNNDLEILNYDYKLQTEMKKEEIEIFIIFNDILKKINDKYLVFDKELNEYRPCIYSDFTVLIDRLTTSDIFKKISDYLNVPLTIYKDIQITNGIIFQIFKNIINLIISVKNNNYDNSFKHSYISILRSFLFEVKDDEIFEIFKNNNYQNTLLIEKIKDISNKLDYSNISIIIDEIISSFNIYEKLILIGDIESNIVDINYIKKLADNLIDLDYDINKFNEYLDNIDKNDLNIKYSSNISEDNSVKLMTIHKSKGLEFSICYYSMLFKEFNLSDLNDKIIYDNKYGIITPYIKEGISDTIIKTLVKKTYYEQEISEKIRLFYVALTRSKEKIIILTDNINDEYYIKKYKSFKDILLKVKDKLDKYIINIDYSKLNINSNYKLNKNSKNLISNKEQIIKVKEINIPSTFLEETSFSKKVNKLKTKNEIELLKQGEYIHYILEVLDFKNPNYEIIKDDYIKEKITTFLNIPLLKDIKESKIYKEYEFITEIDNIKKHGIIDLMLEYNDHIDIIDYKLKNIDDTAYIKQLNGYKEYISNISNKKVNLYLYSIIDSNIKSI